MRWIYISPHLDDAVLSAGGLIYEQTKAGIPVEIWTLMCGVPQETELSMYAQVMHHQWGFSSAEETVRVRRVEEEVAAAILGAKTVCFDFLDCIYRRSQNGDWLYMDVFLPPHKEDADIPRQIARTIAPHLTHDTSAPASAGSAQRLGTGDVLVCQLGLGSHVDHVLVRQGIELIGYPLLYAADVPYLFKHPESLGPSTARMKETVHAVTEAGLRAWQDAVDAYASQLGSLFESPDDVHESIRRYWAERGGIPLWSPA